MKMATVRLDEELLKQAKIYAINAGLTLQAVVAEGLRLVIATKPQKKEGQS
jgi:post-segregation antitoxin (ccd killing protein)